jgi:hypothetical protein
MTTGERSGRLSIIPEVAIDDVRMQHAPLRMLVALGTYADQDGWCWPKQGTLAQRLGISRQAVAASLRDLKAWGYVEIHAQYSPTNGARIESRYRIVRDLRVPPEYLRTPPTDIAPPVNPSFTPPVKLDFTSPPENFTGPVNPSLTPPVKASFTAIEQPIGTTQENNPRDTEPPAQTAKAPSDQTAILRGLSDGAREVLDWHRQCHGRRQPAKLTPESARVLEAAVEDLGVDRLKESVRYMAGKIPPVPELSKAISAAKTKRQRDESGPTPQPVRRNGQDRLPPGAASKQKSDWSGFRGRHGSNLAAKGTGDGR